MVLVLIYSTSTLYQLIRMYIVSTDPYVYQRSSEIERVLDTANNLASNMQDQVI